MSPALKMPDIRGVEVARGRAAIELFLPDELYWFQGHFPGMPVLPGVVQIDWALEFGRHFLKLPVDAALDLRVKFVAPMRPRDRLVLTLSRDTRRFSFAYHRDGAACSSGQVAL